MIPSFCPVVAGIRSPVVSHGPLVPILSGSVPITNKLTGIASVIVIHERRRDYGTTRMGRRLERSCVRLKPAVRLKPPPPPPESK